MIESGAFAHKRIVLSCTLIVILAVLVALAAGVQPRQALADTALQAGSIDSRFSTDEASNQDESLLVQSQNMNDARLRSSATYLLTDSRYSDGVIILRAVCIGYSNYNDGTATYPLTVEIIGVQGGTWLKVPESVSAELAANLIESDVQALFASYKSGEWENNKNKQWVEGILDRMLESGWRNQETCSLKRFSNKVAPVSAVNHVSAYQLYETDFANSTWNDSQYRFDTIQTLTFEETSSASGMPAISVNHAFASDSTTGYTCQISNVTLPSARRYELYRSFAGSSGLTSITLTQGCRSATGAFADCVNLRAANLLETRVGLAVSSNMFDGCTSLASVSLGSNIAGIGYSAFEGCTSLESITLPDSVTFIDEWAFQGCTSLSSVRWPDNPEFTRVDGFADCTSLPASAVSSLPSSVTAIGIDPMWEDASEEEDYPGAFSNCSFMELDIPDTITSIGARSFYGCSGLDGQTVTIPAGVQVIGTQAFAISDPNGNKPASITLDFENPDFTFAPIEGVSASNLFHLADSESESAAAYYNPFGNTYVTFLASETGANGQTSLLKQAYDTYYVYEDPLDSFSMAEPMKERTLPGSTTRKEYWFGERPAEGVSHAVTGTVPTGANVIVTSGGIPVAVATSALENGASFAASAEEGADVQVRVTLEGYHDRVFEKSAADFTSDWQVCNLTVGDFTASSGESPSGAIYQYSANPVVVGLPFVVEARYALPEDSSAGVVTFTLPEGSTLHSVSNETLRLGVSSDRANSYTVPVTSESGRLFLKLSVVKDGEITGQVACDGAVGVMEPLEIDCELVRILACSTPVSLSDRNQMIVSTAPGANVTVKVGQTAVSGSVKANSAGTAYVPFRLSSVQIDGAEVELLAEANGGIASTTVSTKSQGIAVTSLTMERAGVLSELRVSDVTFNRNFYIAYQGSPDLRDAYWPFTATIETDVPLNTQLYLKAYGTSFEQLFKVTMNVSSEERTDDGGYRYMLSGAFVDQDYLDAYVRWANKGVFAARCFVPIYFKLVDGNDSDIAVTLLRGIIDPSGMVYEAVPSNVLSGVTATIRYASDGLGTDARDWTEATDYDQVTSVLTDANGAYAWDVPEGWWQVAFSKEGYVSTSTSWMEVQPPRVGLKTALVSTALPTVRSAQASSDAIEISFSQYMKTGKVGADAGSLDILVAAADDDYSGVAVTINGEAVSGDRLQWVDCEESLDGESLSRTLKILPPSGGAFSGTLALNVSGARNYVGNAMAAPYLDELSVASQTGSEDETGESGDDPAGGEGGESGDNPGSGDDPGSGEGAGGEGVGEGSGDNPASGEKDSGNEGAAGDGSTGGDQGGGSSVGSDESANTKGTSASTSSAGTATTSGTSAASATAKTGDTTSPLVVLLFSLALLSAMVMYYVTYTLAKCECISIGFDE